MKYISILMFVFCTASSGCYFGDGKSEPTISPFTQEDCAKLCAPLPIALWTPGCFKTNDFRSPSGVECPGPLGRIMMFDVCRCGPGK